MFMLHEECLQRISPRVDKCLSIGYPQGQKGWKVYNLQTHTFHTSRDIFFYEDTYPFLQASKPPSINTNKYIAEYYNDDEELHPPQTKTVQSVAAIPPTNAQETTTTSTNLETHDVDILHHNHAPESPTNTFEPDEHNTPNPVSASNIPYNNEHDTITSEYNKEHNNSGIELPPRIRQPPQHLKDLYLYNMHSNIKYPFSNFVHYDTFSPNHKAYLAIISNTVEPTSYIQASKLKVWKDVMAQELQALEDNQTWELTTLPPGEKLIGC